MSGIRMRKWSLLLIFALILAGITSVVAQEDTVSTGPGDPVRLGLAAGLSGEGIAPLGIDIRRGAELALEDRPTVTVNGAEFEVELDVQDSQCNAEGGQAVANRFTSDESIIGVVGHMCSSSCSAALPIYDSAGFTTISPSCTSPVLTLGDSSSFNRAVPSDGFQGAIAAEYIYNELGVRRIATVHDGSPYGEGLVQVVTTNFEELGGEVVAADAITVGDTDFRPLLEELATEEPELIYFGGFPAEGARLIQQRFDAGLGDTLFMGADGIQGTEVIELAGDFAEGIYASAPIPSSTEAAEAFLERYEEAFGEQPPAPFHANAYDAVNIFLDAVEAVGTVDDDGNLMVSRAALSEYVRTLEGFSGLVGDLSADGTGETFSSDQVQIGVFQVVDGEFVTLTTFGGAAEDEGMGEDEDMGEEGEDEGEGEESDS